MQDFKSERKVGDLTLSLTKHPHLQQRYRLRLLDKEKSLVPNMSSGIGNFDAKETIKFFDIQDDTAFVKALWGHYGKGDGILARDIIPAIAEATKVDREIISTPEKEQLVQNSAQRTPQFKK